MKPFRPLYEWYDVQHRNLGGWIHRYNHKGKPEYVQILEYAFHRKELSPEVKVRDTQGIISYHALGSIWTGPTQKGHQRLDESKEILKAMCIRFVLGTGIGRRGWWFPMTDLERIALEGERDEEACCDGEDLQTRD